MKIYRAVKTNRITQLFGENKVPFYKQLGMKGHNGIDFKCWSGEPVVHACDWDGWAYTEVDRDGGVGVNVVSKEPIGESYYKVKYWHLGLVGIYDGQEVKPGQVIGWGDNTGLSTGTHLHFGLKKCDKEGNSLNLGNGYYGGIDPMPYFINEPAIEVLNKGGTHTSKRNLLLSIIITLLRKAEIRLK